MKKIYFLFLMCAAFLANGQSVATFDSLALDENSFWNGSDESGSFKSGSFTFYNNFNAAWGSWDGFSYTNQTDVITADYSNQYSAITGTGNNQSVNYATAWVSGNALVELDSSSVVSGLYLTNSTYAYYSMFAGDAFSKKFGGESGSDPDYFKLLIYGFDESGNTTGCVDFYLADYRFSNSLMDYIINDWTWVDLSVLGEVKNLHFILESTDNGDWGMNTPAYFCIDDLGGNPPAMVKINEADIEDVVFDSTGFYNGADLAGGFTSEGFLFKNMFNLEWGSWSGFAASSTVDIETRGYGNQYSSIAGSGALETSNYAVAYVSGVSEIEFSDTVLNGCYLTNSTYAYWSMKEGDQYAKMFGGTTGNEEDWFKIDIYGIDTAGNISDSIEFYLADFRFADNTLDYIVDDWQWLDLSSLGRISKLQFKLSSSDNGNWGMNTPAYFCIDQLNHFDEAPVVINPIADVGRGWTPGRIFYLPLDSVFTDYDNSDSLMEFAIESSSNQDIVSASIYQLENAVTHVMENFIKITIAENSTGQSVVTVSATSNGKKTNHSFIVVARIYTVASVLNEPEFKTYPNPFVDRIKIKMPVNEGTYSIYDVSGKIIRMENFYNQNEIEISGLGNIPSGIYFVKIISEDQSYSTKLVKK